MEATGVISPSTGKGCKGGRVDILRDKPLPTADRLEDKCPKLPPSKGVLLKSVPANSSDGPSRTGLPVPAVNSSFIGSPSAPSLLFPGITSKINCQHLSFVLDLLGGEPT